MTAVLVTTIGGPGSSSGGWGVALGVKVQVGVGEGPRVDVGPAVGVCVHVGAGIGV